MSVGHLPDVMSPAFGGADFFDGVALWDGMQVTQPTLDTYTMTSDGYWMGMGQGAPAEDSRNAYAGELAASRAGSSAAPFSWAYELM